MKAALICPPAAPAISQLSESAPLAAAPLLGECLAALWIEHLASLGAREIYLYAADRIAQVRSAVGNGSRWGVTIEFVPCKVEPTAGEVAALHGFGSPSGIGPASPAGWLPSPGSIVEMTHLPGCPEFPLFKSYASWQAALVAWLPRALTPARVRVAELRPGIWVNRRARVSSRAQLIAPCWIGDQVIVSPGAIVGPGAVVEDRAVIEPGARVQQGVIGPDTYVGRMTAVTNSLAYGSVLINCASDSWLNVPDPFLLSSLSRPTAKALQNGRKPVHAPELSPIAAASAWWSRLFTRPAIGPQLPAENADRT